MRLFEEEGISYVLLKGSIMRSLYPEAWMRTSCDIDILVHEEQVDHAVSVLKSRLKYSCPEGRKFHDIDLYSPSGVHLEPHYSLAEPEEYIGKMNDCLSRVWDNVVPLEGHSFGCRETPEFFVFHHISHMAFHMLGGGCGVRPFLDLRQIERNLQYDRAALDSLLRDSGITGFRKAADELTEHLLDGHQASDTVMKMKQYIVDGGVYGTDENRLTVQSGAAGGMLRYFLRRIFIPFDALEALYPWLKNRRFLAPLAYVLRFFRLFRKNSVSRVRAEVSSVRAVGRQEQAEALALMRELGLK